VELVTAILLRKSCLSGEALRLVDLRLDCRITEG